MVAQPSRTFLAGTSTNIEDDLRKHEEKLKKNKEFMANEKNIEINRSN